MKKTEFFEKNEISLRFYAAKAIIEEAASLALSMRPSPGGPSATLKGRQDYVTEADRAVELMVYNRLSTLFPDDGFIGEERGEQAQGTYRWVLDPIDGTSNYARGRNRWCISLGLMKNNLPVAGIINAPALKEIFTAIRGEGAFLNGKPIYAAKTKNLDESMVEIGWSPFVPLEWWQEKTTAILNLGSMPRSLGSGALALADVACGRSDGYLEKVIYIWDVAAALVILEEADARISPFIKMGGIEKRTTILATAPNIASQLSKALGVELG
ncbi:inositol monophosphatase family protein [Aristophania vespae]|uniref:inositol monophosphatase family protein n=1 Tax=Aristophania vespae TaxID=2697033 RepID=UPI002351A968|nr:inositol monophosphatase family protein [Aristophania vespae]UMM63264.1 Inositol-1-monophosphatase [Aristophania vespae]